MIAERITINANATAARGVLLKSGTDPGELRQPMYSSTLFATARPFTVEAS
jgi:hypothetical protein